MCGPVQVAQNVCDACRGGGLLVIGDGDTGFGGSGNVRRTMRGYATAGLAGISIEDQVILDLCSVVCDLYTVCTPPRSRSPHQLSTPATVAALQVYPKRCSFAKGLAVEPRERTWCTATPCTFHSVHC